MGYVWRFGYGSALLGLLLMAGPVKAIGVDAAAPAATPSLRINDLSRAEGNMGSAAFSFTVTAAPASASRVTVNYATANGTALAGSDYTAASGTLTFNPGQTSRPLTVSVRGDTVREPNETFVVNLSAPSGATLFDKQGQGTLLNDDGLMLRRLNDTGITRCANETQNDLNCPVNGFPGQDAQYGRDRTHNDPSDGHAGFIFTKISNSGQPLPASAALGSGPNDWACTRDNVTGLIWEVKTDDGGLRDKDWIYSWYNPDPSSNGGFAGYPDSEDDCFDPARCDTHKFAADVNSRGLCGASDWRLPSVEQLLSIVSNDRAYPAPAVDSVFFPNTESDYTGPLYPYWWFWSSSPDAEYSSDAWDVAFYTGDAFPGDKSTGKSVRLVRGGAWNEQ